MAPLLCGLALVGASAAPLAAPPAVERARARPPRPFEKPDQAEAYYRLRRQPEAGIEPGEAYRRARLRMAEMPLYSSRREAFVERAAGFQRAAALDSWTSLGPGNIGGRVRAMVFHPRNRRTIYLGGVSGGIWKSTNGGKRWQAIGDELSNLAVNALAVDPSDPAVIYAGTGEGYFREEVRGTGLPLRGAGIFKSEDGGESWKQLAKTDDPDFFWVNDLWISPVAPSRIYAATRKGVFRSTDGGESWTRVLKTSVRGGCLDLVGRTDRATDYLFASCGTLERATIYRNPSAEGEGEWEAVLSEPEMGRTSLAIAPSNQNMIYALSASNVPGPEGRFEQGLHAVFRSGGSGAAGTWNARVRNDDPRKINTMLLTNPIVAFNADCGFDGGNGYLTMGWYVNAIAVDPRDPDRVWAAGVDAFRSDDGGANWNPASRWWVAPSNRWVHADVHAFVFHPKKIARLYALTDGGVFRTNKSRGRLANGDLAVCEEMPDGVAWRGLNRDLGVTQFYHGNVFPDGRSYFGGAQDNGTLLGSDGGGSNGWVRIFGGDGGYSAVDPSNPLVIYASYQNGNFVKSTDGGFNFGRATVGIEDLAAPVDDFTAIHPNFLFITPLAMDPGQSQRLWVAGRRIWRTDDGATSWGAASTVLASRAKGSAVAVSPSDSNRVLVGSDVGRIFISSSATMATPTSAWSSVRPRKGFVTSIAFDPTNPEVAYATYGGFGGKHVWRTTSSGASWEPIDGNGKNSVPDIPVHSIVVDPNDTARLYLGTDLGVLVSLDQGVSWAVENTGFAAAVTEWLSLGQGPGGARNLYAFTHGRGVWRVPLE